MARRRLAAVGLILLAAFLAWLLFGPRTGDDPSHDGPDATDVGDVEASGKDAEPTLRGVPGDGPGADPHASPPGTQLPIAPTRPQSAPIAAVPDVEEMETVVEIRVQVGEGDLASGRVVVRRMHLDPGDAMRVTTHVIPRDGVVQVPEAGGFALFEVEVHGRQERSLVLRRGRASEPVEVVFGTGEVYGTVRDDQGQPDEGVGVRLTTYTTQVDGAWGSSAEGSEFGMATTTDFDGAYRFTDLPTGTFVVVARRSDDDPAADRNIRSSQVTLGAGERVRVDFGEEHVEPLLEGVLRYMDGVPVRRPVNMFLKMVEGEGRLYVNTDAEGRFSQRVPAGVYAVEMVMSSPMTPFAMRLVPSSHRVTLADENTPPQDVTFPGTRIVGRVRDLPAGPQQAITATLLEPREDAPVSRISGRQIYWHRTSVEEDGTFLLDGLSPGIWRLSAAPRAIHPVEIRVAATQPVVHVDVELKDE
jgi:hypothetical protein